MLHTFLEIFRKTLKDDVIILNLQVMEQAQKKCHSNQELNPDQNDSKTPIISTMVWILYIYSFEERKDL